MWQPTGRFWLHVSPMRAQVFAGVITLQPLELIPLPTFPEQYDRVEYFDVPPQNL